MSLQVQYANAGSGLPLPPLDPVILGGVLPQASSKPPQKPINDVTAFKEIYQAALAFLKGGELEKAQEAFREVVRLYPAAETYVLLGYSYFFAGDELRAANHFEKATRLNPQDEQAYFSLTLAYKGLGKIEKAVKAVRNVLRIEPDNPRAHFMLGYLQSRLGRWREAEVAYRRAIELKEDLGEAYQYLAVMHYELGLSAREEDEHHFRKAIKVYQELLGKFPEASYVYVNIGQILDHLGEPAEAAAAYQKAISAAGDDLAGLTELGTSLLNARRYAEAKGVLERAISKLKEKPEPGMMSLPQLLTCSGVASLCMYAERAEDSGDEALLREAEEKFNSALSLDPNYVHALVDLAGVYYERGRLDEAVETFKQALERDPVNEAARDNLITILEDRLEEGLIEKGLLKQARPPIKDFSPYEGRKPIVVRGRPLSETLLEDRR
jgi:tetratricopeptide (TPR) repeat protein